MTERVAERLQPRRRLRVTPSRGMSTVLLALVFLIVLGLGPPAAL